MCRDFIRRHINNLPPGQIFCTREVLIYGKRSAVDSTLRTMVDLGSICRLARGVFIQEGFPEPELKEIVKAKLNAYRSRPSTCAEEELHDLALIPLGNPNTFAKNGSSSSFLTVKGRVYLQNICERKMFLCQSVVGHFIYALWFLHNRGKRRLLPHAMKVVSAKFGRTERELAWLSSALMPAWLRELARPIFPKPKIVMDNPFQCPM